MKNQFSKRYKYNRKNIQYHLYNSKLTSCKVKSNYVARISNITTKNTDHITTDIFEQSKMPVVCHKAQCVWL